MSINEQTLRFNLVQRLRQYSHKSNINRFDHRKIINQSFNFNQVLIHKPTPKNLSHKPKSQSLNLNQRKPTPCMLQKQTPRVNPLLTFPVLHFSAQFTIFKLLSASLYFLRLDALSQPHSPQLHRLTQPPPPSPSSSQAVSGGIRKASVFKPDVGVVDVDDDVAGVVRVRPEAGGGGEEVGSASGVEAVGIFSVDLGLC
ncbi:hypothetical protein Droror1_Dr00003894 [Drosera rotundifolia]